jgi:hypothetical protein
VCAVLPPRTGVAARTSPGLRRPARAERTPERKCGNFDRPGPAQSSALRGLGSRASAHAAGARAGTGPAADASAIGRASTPSKHRPSPRDPEAPTRSVRRSAAHDRRSGTHFTRIRIAAADTGRRELGGSAETSTGPDRRRVPHFAGSTRGPPSTQRARAGTGPAARPSAIGRASTTSKHLREPR